MNPQALAQAIGVLTTGPLQDVGDTFSLPGGRKYKYCKFANSSAIIGGTQVYSVISSASSLAITTVANGQVALNLTAPSQTLTVVSTGSVTADVYAGGYAQVTQGSDVYSVRIAHNTGVTGAGNFTLTFSDSLQNTVALVPGTDTVTVETSPDTASTSTSSGNISCGYTVNNLPASSNTKPLYGYTQVSGYSAVTGTILNVE